MKNLVVAFLFFAIILLPKINYASHASGMDLTYECLTSDTVWTGNYQVLISTQAFGAECSWNIVDDNTGAVIASGSGYNNNTTYTINVCVPSGNYTFNWFDSWGDGWNGGSYTVTTNTGTVLASGSPPTGNSGSSGFISPGSSCTYTITNYPANTYRVTLKFYRDCSNGIPAPGSFPLDYNSNTCGSNNSVTMNQVSSQNITPTCGAISDPCNTPGVVGIEEYIYQATITLPNNCPDWILSVCEAARNNAITTINNPGSQNLCVQSELNNTSNYNNNSPIFTAYPTPYLCVGQQYCYNNGATDPDGDSLVYSLVTPLNTAPGGTINYNAGFSAFNPISGTTTFDSFTGDLCMLSNQVQVSVVAMKVSEFRNEIFIGSVIRDIQIIVLNNCATLPPVLTGINGSPQDVTTASTIETSVNHCSNGIDPVVFTINASLGASNNKVMSWNGLSGTNTPTNTPTFSVISNNTNNPSGSFNWIPDYADVLNSPFYFTVSVEDDACPINNLFSFTYTLNLTSSSNFLVSEFITKESCPGDNDGAIDITITGISGVPTFSWTGPNGFTSSSQNITSLEIGTYNLTITAPDGCETYYIYDVLSNSVSLSLNDTIMPSCNGSSDGSVDLTVTGGVTPFSYSWIGPNGFTSVSQDLSNLSAGTYSVTVADDVLCSNTLSVTLTDPSPMVTSGSVTSDYNGSEISCNGDSDGIITGLVSGGTGPYMYSIDQLNYTSTQIFSALNANIYTISYEDANGCSISEDITLSNPSSININLITKEDISCFGSADGSIDITANGGTQIEADYSLNFDGVDDFIEIPQGDSFFGSSGDFSISSWVKIDQFIGSQEPIFESNIENELQLMVVNNDGRLTLNVGGGLVAESLPLIWNLNQWYYVTVINNSGTASFYRDAVAITSIPFTVGNINSRSFTSLNLGKDDQTNNFYLNGSLDDFSYFNIALTQNDIQNHMNCSPIGNENGLIGFWDFGEGSGSLVQDLTLNGNDGTINGSLYSADVPVQPCNISNNLYNYSWVNTLIGFSSNSEDLLNINQSGTYSLIVTDANSCSSSVFIENIFEPTAIITLPPSLQSITCFGASDGIISLLASGGTPPYTFDWIGPNAYLNSQNTNPSNITQLNTGNYDYTITDNKGCSLQSIAPIYISEPSQINVVLDPSLVSCSGVADGSVNLLTNISSPLFEWTCSADLNYFETSEDITGLEQGVYTVKVTDPVSLCFESAFTTISIITPFNISPNTLDESCYNENDGEIKVNPISNAAYEFLWYYPDGSTSDDVDIDALSPGLYQLIISYNSVSSSGITIDCQVARSFTIFPAEEIVAIPSLNLVSCEGGNDGGIALGNVSGGFGNFNYLWSNAESTKDINNLTTGTYSVTILDENNCIWDSTFNLTSIVFDTSSVLRNNILCKGDATGSIDIGPMTGGIYPYTFSWTGPNGFSSNNEDLTNLLAGAYLVEITDANGCVIERYKTLSEPNDTLYAIPEFVGDAKCNGSSDGFVVLDSTDISGGTPPYEQDWVSANPDSLSAGNYDYIIYDSNNCFLTGNVTINEPPLLTITPFVTKIKCPNQNTGSISVLINNFIGSPTVEWTGPNDIITNQIFSASGLSIDSLYAGNYNCIVTDDSNCTVQQTIYVSEPYTRAGSPLFLTSNHTYFEVSCKGGSDAWIEVTMDGGDYSFNTYEYLWENGETSDSIFSLSADTLSLTVIDSINCSQEFSYIIREPDSLVSFTYLISDFNNYNISCYNASDGFVELDPKGGVHNYSYIYYVNDVLDPNLNSNILSNLKSDNLFIIVKDNNGCQYSDTINLIQPELLQIELNLKPDTCSLNKGYADVNVSGGVPNYTYSWSNGSIDSFSDYISEGSYDITVIDANTCEHSESFDIYNLASPIANFSLNPSHKKFDIQLEEPFVFIDISETFTQKIKNWTWYFSDNSLGNDSIVQHSFSEIGEYQVLLEIETEYNCFDTISKSVVVDNYNLWVPDTFTPNDDGVNDSFKPYGVGIKKYKIQIFSRWGEVIFFSEDINNGWDGSSRNNNTSMNGSFTYYIEIVNVYNEFFKYNGTIKLIR